MEVGPAKPAQGLRFARVAQRGLPACACSPTVVDGYRASRTTTFGVACKAQGETWPGPSRPTIGPSRPTRAWNHTTTVDRVRWPRGILARRCATSKSSRSLPQLASSIGIVRCFAIPGAILEGALKDLDRGIRWSPDARRIYFERRAAPLKPRGTLAMRPRRPERFDPLDRAARVIFRGARCASGTVEHDRRFDRPTTMAIRLNPLPSSRPTTTLQTLSDQGGVQPGGGIATKR